MHFGRAEASPNPEPGSEGFAKTLGKALQANARECSGLDDFSAIGHRSLWVVVSPNSHWGPFRTPGPLCSASGAHCRDDLKTPRCLGGLGARRPPILNDSLACRAVATKTGGKQ
jgi:hypothetical protein